MTTAKSTFAEHARLAREDESDIHDDIEHDLTFAEVEEMLSAMAGVHGGKHYLRLGPAAEKAVDGNQKYVVTIMRSNAGKPGSKSLLKAGAPAWSVRGEGRGRTMEEAVRAAFKNAGGKGRKS